MIFKDRSSFERSSLWESVKDLIDSVISDLVVCFCCIGFDRLSFGIKI